MENESYEPPKKKLKKNKKAKDNYEVDKPGLNTSEVDKFDEESITYQKKKKKKHKEKDKHLSIESIEDSCSLKKKKKKEKYEKLDLQEPYDCDVKLIENYNKTTKFIFNDKSEKSENNFNQIQLNSQENIGKNICKYSDKKFEEKSYHGNKDTESIKDSSSLKKKKKNKKSEKHSLQETNGNDVPMLGNCVKPTNFTNDENSDANSENNLNKIQSHFYENRGKNINKYSEQKFKRKRSYYPDIKETVSLPSKGRHYTVSIALPASILKETCLIHVLRTYVIGQLARAACIYSIDEIIIYNDQPRNNNRENNYFVGMMKMILEYQECPQYLRKDFFPICDYLKDSGVLNVLTAPHHLLASQWCEYREGVVRSRVSGKSSYADIGLKSEVLIDKKLEPGLRVTVKLPPEVKTLNKMYGYVVSPDEPRVKTGLYWGYTVRVARCLSEVFKSDRFSNGYDLIIGTSDKGNVVDEVDLKKFSNALILFGGVQGLEAAKNADDSLSKSDDIRSLCHHYVNVCPNQSSRTIRTEEAVLITLSTLCPKLTIKGCTKSK